MCDMEDFFNNMPSLAVIATYDGFLKKTNTSWSTVLGYSQDELQSRNFLDYIHPEDVDSTYNEIKKGQNSSLTIAFKNRYRCKNGSYKLLEWEACKSSNGDIYATAHVITNNKKIREKLLRYESRYKMIEKIANFGIWEYNIKTKETWASDQCKLIYGFDPKLSDFSIKAVEECIPEKEKVHLTLEDLVRNNKEYRLEIEFFPKNADKSITISSIAEIERDKSGNPLFIYGIIQDITEQKQAEATLKQEKWLLSNIIDVTNVGTWEWNIQTDEIIINENWAEFIGYTLKELSPTTIKTWTNNLHPDDVAHSEELLDKHFTGELPYYDCECRMKHKDGSWIWIHDRGKVVKWTNDGKPLKMYGTHTNITERKEAEEILYRAQKLESLGVLAGGIAHDFNNLLSGIYSSIQLAMQSADSKANSYLDLSLKSMDRARSLTQQILTFAKGGKPIKKEGSLFPFVKEVTNFALSGTSVSSVFNIEKGLWLCDFDKNQIGQVIENVIINATQAMPNGGIINITAENLKQYGDNYVKLTIKDNGIGIPEDLESKIFDPYFTTKAKGNGLGLSTCHSIITQHGGSIDIESIKNEGTTCSIYLPSTKINESITVKYKEVLSSSMHTNSGTFLIMDDDEIILIALEAILEDFGYKVILTRNGQDAIDAFNLEYKAGRELTGMIFDLTIPGGIGGKDAIIEIRKTCKTTPAFVCSGYSEDPVIANPEKYGFNASLCKPFKMEELSNMLEKHLLR